MVLLDFFEEGCVDGGHCCVCLNGYGVEDVGIVERRTGVVVIADWKVRGGDVFYVVWVRSVITDIKKV